MTPRPPPGTPGAALETDVLDFGDEQVGKPTIRAVRVTSVGTAPLEISSVRVRGAHPADFTTGADDCAGATLQQGASCIVEVEFRPVETGARRAALLLTDNAPGGSETVALRGKGIAPRSDEVTPRRDEAAPQGNEAAPQGTEAAPQGTEAAPPPPGTPGLSVRPDAENFGEVAVGGSSLRRFTITSAGTVAAEIREVSVTGSQASDFQKTGDSCSGRTLPPEADCTVDLDFRPTEPGRRAATLLVAHDGPESPEEATLRGTATPLPPNVAAVTLLPAVLDFGDVTRGGATSRTVSVASIGTAPLTVASVRLAGADRDDFTTVADGCSGRTLSPGRFLHGGP